MTHLRSRRRLRLLRRPSFLLCLRFRFLCLLRRLLLLLLIRRLLFVLLLTLFLMRLQRFPILILGNPLESVTLRYLRPYLANK